VQGASVISRRNIAEYKIYAKDCIKSNVNLLSRLKTGMTGRGTFVLHDMRRICLLLKLTVTLDCSL